MSQSVEALRHKMGLYGFDSRYGPCKISSYAILLSAFSSAGVHTTSNRNEYRGISLQVKCDWHVELTALSSWL